MANRLDTPRKPLDITGSRLCILRDGCQTKLFDKFVATPSILNWYINLSEAMRKEN